MARKREARAAADQADQAEAARHEAEFLDRQRAADFLGLSIHQFKRLHATGKGPACVKAGDSPQSPVRWTLTDLRAFKDDPAAYVAAMAKRG